MKRIIQVIAVLLIGILTLALLDGCARRPQLKLKAYIDGSDVVKVRGGQLWFEHETFRLPAKITVNGKPWSPAWTTNISSTFDGISPPLNPHDPKSIKISKLVGRGNVTLIQTPTADNDQTLAVRLDDGEFGGADWYEIVVSW